MDKGTELLAMLLLGAFTWAGLELMIRLWRRYSNRRKDEEHDEI